MHKNVAKRLDITQFTQLNALGSILLLYTRDFRELILRQWKGQSYSSWLDEEFQAAFTTLFDGLVMVIKVHQFEQSLALLHPLK